MLKSNIPTPQEAAEKLVGLVGIKRRGRRPTNAPPAVPGKPQRYWGRNAIISTSGVLVPGNPTGPYSYYGYRLGRLKGESHGRAIARGANWEGRSSASGIVGGMGALYLAGHKDKAVQQAWKATSKPSPPSWRKLYRAPLHVKRTVGRLLPHPGRALAALYREGARSGLLKRGGPVRGIGRAVAGALPALMRSRTMKYYGIYHAPGWALQASMIPVAATKWRNAQRAAKQHWGDQR